MIRRIRKIKRRRRTRMIRVFPAVVAAALTKRMMRMNKNPFTCKLPKIKVQLVNSVSRRSSSWP